MCALIKAGGLISEIRGSIGGYVFSRGKSGATIRSRVIPVQPNSDSQLEIRYLVATLANQWATVLSVGQRQSWTDYAALTPWTNKLGETIYLTGMNWFIKCNITRMMVGMSIKLDIDTEHLIGANLQNVSFTLTMVAAKQVSVAFTGDQPWNAANCGIALFLSRQQNPGINYFKGPWRYFGFVEGTTPATVSPIAVVNGDFPFTYAADNGNVFVKAVCVYSTGEVSNEQIFGPLTTT